MRVVAGVDGSAESRRALSWAIGEAKAHAAPLHVVHVWHYPYGIAPAASFATREELREAFRADAERILAAEVQFASDSGVTVTSALLEGPPAAELVREATEDDLLVVGSHGRGGFTGLLLGSVGHQCTHHARCPVVIVPSGRR